MVHAEWVKETHKILVSGVAVNNAMHHTRKR